MFLLKVVKALEHDKLPYAIVGGFAMILHGAVRGTIDLDLVIHLTLKDFKQLEATLLSLGLKPRLPVSAEMVFRFRKEYITEKNLITWSFYNPNQAHEVVDIILTEDLKKIKTVKKTFAGNKLSVVNIEGLIAMKTKASRPQDLADIEALKLILTTKTTHN
jgi:hypothetical protein